ncbi:MAG TPA: hypothetical protein VGM23_17120 [Armatimonadota bacterium]|jgi:hypothetical protein
MKRTIVYDVLIVLALAAIIAVVGCAGKHAARNTNQATTTTTAGGGGMQGGGGGGQFAQMREKYKNTFALSRFAGNIGKLEEEGKVPLTPAQAKAVLAVLEPLRTKTTLSQDEAKDALKGLKAALNEQQLTEIGKMKQPQRGRGQGGGMGQGGQGGGMGQGGGRGQGGGTGQGGGQRRAFDPNTMKDFNPFNPPKDSPMAQRGIERWNKFFDALKKKANG